MKTSGSQSSSSHYRTTFILCSLSAAPFPRTLFAAYVPLHLTMSTWRPVQTFCKHLLRNLLFSAAVKHSLGLLLFFFFFYYLLNFYFCISQRTACYYSIFLSSSIYSLEKSKKIHFSFFTKYFKKGWVSSSPAIPGVLAKLSNKRKPY